LKRAQTHDHIRGFTLVELIMVIVITGIIAGVVTIFMRSAIQGYFDTVRRADLSDVADTSLRRIARDVQTALPNSVRTPSVAGSLFMELLPVRSGGRYRASADGSTDALDVSSAADNTFDILGPGITVAAGDSIVIYNTGQSGADAYAGPNRRAFSGTAGAAVTNVSFSGGQFPRHSPTYRFDVVSTPVTYACDAARSTLWRFSGYTIQSTQPNALTAGGQLVTDSGNKTGSALATNVVCSDAGNIGTSFEVRNADGLISLRIELQSSGETLNLFREVHVSNAP
jgi:MSHA biogenesis protein MshO